MQRNLIINLLLILIVIVFTLQNHEPVLIRLLLWNVEVSKALLVVFVLFIGVLMGVFTSSVTAYRKNKKMKKEEAKKLQETKETQGPPEKSESEK
ncbi:MAG: LapA family protein [Bacteroidales bacterium]|nr:LapA family protein [Bacteroidales bacterium]